MSQWIPTHVQCTIVRARDLRIKGKSGQNDAFVTIQLNKEKFQTSTVKSGATAEWNEECDLPLTHTNDWLVLTVCHKNFFGVDEFLGRCELPLNEFDWNERPRARWFALRAKQGKKHENKEHKLRGEVQIMLKFYAQNLGLSTPDLAHKKSSLASTLKHSIGASLRNLHKPGKNDGAAGYPSPLSRMNNANSQSNLSLAQQQQYNDPSFNNNLPRGFNVSQTLPRNLGGANNSGNANNAAALFNSPVLRSARARSPSSVSQSVALSAPDKSTRNDAVMTSNYNSSIQPASPLLSSPHQSRTSPTSLIDETFRESVKNVEADNNNRFTVSTVAAAVAAPTAATRGVKSAAPPPPPAAASSAAADSTKSSRRVPKVHKLTAGASSVVGNLLANNSSTTNNNNSSNSAAANPFEDENDDENSPQVAARGVGGTKQLNGNNRRSTGSSFYADGDSLNANSNNRLGVAPRNGNRRSTSNSYGDGAVNDDAGQNPFENSSRNNNNNNNVATAVLNRSTSNRSSLVSEQQPTSSKGTSLERNQPPPTSAQFYATNGNAVRGAAANGYSNGNMNGYAVNNNNARLPVSNLARVEATISSALKPLTQSRVPRDLELKYGHMERNDLLIRLAQLENDIESKDIEIDRMKSYLESLLSRVMEKCPELLHSSPE